MPNAVEGHDSPELEIYGMDGVPAEDLQRHYDGLPIVSYTKSKLIIGDASILPILAAQKVSVAAQLAESKNMTVQGDLGVVAGIVSPGTGTAAPAVVSPVLSTGSSVPAAVNTGTTGAEYWNNPYVMAAYYQQYQTGQAVQYPAPANPYAQYYGQNYYQAYANYYNSTSVSNSASASVPSAVNPSVNNSVPTAVNNSVNTEIEVPPTASSSIEISLEPLTIPPYFDPITNKQMPGTIFTVLSLDRSMEELRSELKKYRKVKF